MTNRNPEAKFRRDALNVITTSNEAVSMRLDRTEQTTARLADAIEQQSQNVTTLTSNVERLERAITQLVAENAAQRETVNGLIRLATALVEREAG